MTVPQSKLQKPQLIDEEIQSLLNKSAIIHAGALRQKCVLPQNVLSPQEKRGLSPSVRHKPSQHIYRDGSFQDGKFIHPEIPLKQGRLHDKHRLDRRLPVCTNSSNIPTISSVHVAGEVLSIHNNAIRAKCSPAHIHETLKTGCCLASRSRNTVGNLLGRSINNSFLERNLQSPQTIDNRSSRIFGIFDKLREVHANTNSKDSVSRSTDRLGEHEIYFTRSENSLNPERMSTTSEYRISNNSAPIPGIRAPDVLQTGDLVRPVTLSSTSRTSNKVSETMVELRQTSAFNSTRKDGFVMVDNKSTIVERQSYNPSNSRCNDNFGCLQVRLGGNLRPTENRGEMVPSRSSGSHQHSRTESSILCSEVLCEISNKPGDLSQVRHHHSGSLSKQLGRHTLLAASSIDPRNLAVVREEICVSSCSTHSGQTQHSSRLRVTNHERSERLETESKCDSPNDLALSSRSVCLSSVSPTRPICELETRPKGNSHGRILNELVQHRSLCLSSVQPGTCSPAQNKNRHGNNSFSCSPVVSTAMVAPSPRATDRLPSIRGERPGPSRGCVQSGDSSSPLPISQTSRLENIRQSFTAAGLSKTATELLSNSVKASTSKSYNCSWAKWSSWCQKRQSNPVLGPIEEILTFLAELFSDGKEYRTINVFRSAISSAHVYIDGKPVGQHPLVVRLMKGISISRPPQPRYQHTWDVAAVTDYLAKLGQNNSLTLKQLSQKLCMLMALTCPERSSIMATLDIRYMRRYPEGIKFLHSTFRKRSIRGNLGESVYPKFSQDPLLCPVQCLFSN